ncbi:WG repeat-containing protein [Spirosoma areae]
MNKLITKPEEPFLIPYRKGNKWGFCDKDKNILVDCVYDSVELFKEGLSNIRKGFSGFIDKSGKETVPCKYIGADNFPEGLARV